MISITETRDLLAAALGSAADIGAIQLPRLYDDNTLPHLGTEIYIICGNPTQTPPSPDIPELIDLTPLGSSTSNNSPRAGGYRAESTGPISQEDQRRDLVNDALRYMAGAVWRYPDADVQLLRILLP